MLDNHGDTARDDRQTSLEKIYPILKLNGSVYGDLPKCRHCNYYYNNDKIVITLENESDGTTGLVWVGCSTCFKSGLKPESFVYE